MHPPQEEHTLINNTYPEDESFEEDIDLEDFDSDLDKPEKYLYEALSVTKIFQQFKESRDQTLLDQKDDNADTPITWLSKNLKSQKYRKVLAAIINSNPSVLYRPEQADKDDNTPALLLAKQPRFKKFLQRKIDELGDDLLKEGHKNKDGDTITHLCIKFNNPQLLDFIIDKDPTVLNHKNNKGDTPATLAAGKEEFKNVLMKMMEINPEILKQENCDGVTLGIRTAWMGFDEMLVEMIKKDPEIIKQKFNYYLPYLAVRGKCIKSFALMIKIDPSVLLEKDTQIENYAIPYLLRQRLTRPPKKNEEELANLVYAYRDVYKQDGLDHVSLNSELFSITLRAELHLDERVPSIIAVHEQITSLAQQIEELAQNYKVLSLDAFKTAFSTLYNDCKSINTAGEKLNKECDNVYPEIFAEYQQLLAALTALTTLQRIDFQFPEEFADHLLAIASDEENFEDNTSLQEDYYQQARLCFQAREQLDAYYLIRYGVSNLTDPSAFLDFYRNFVKQYHDPQKNLAKLNQSNDKAMLKIILKYIDKTDELLKDYLSKDAHDSSIPLGLAARVIDTFEDLLKEINENPSQDSEQLNFVTSSIKRNIQAMREKFIDPVLKENKHFTNGIMTPGGN